jgi:Ca2+-binding EF-hand superfamily protein
MMARPRLAKKQQPVVALEDPPMLTREFTENEILEFKSAFTMFDLDGGGEYKGKNSRESESP